jgi:lysophospholipase L1-like esterase
VSSCATGVAKLLTLRGAATLAVVALVAVLAVEMVVARRRDYPFQPYERLTHRAGGDGDPVRIAMLGDSTVAGVGVPAVPDTLAAQTAERVAAALGRPVVVDGFGVSGARTGEILGLQGEDLDAYDLVVVAIGSNDVTHLTPPWTLRRQTAALLDGLPKPVVLGGIPLFGGATALPRPLRDLVRAYATVLRGVQIDVAAGREGVVFVNIAEEASPRFRGVPDAMSTDGFHPAAVGYGFWADALAAGIVRVLSEG